MDATRSIAAFLRKPWAVYAAAQGDPIPASPTFYTEAPMTFSFNGEWVKAKAYDTCGILFTVRKDLSSWEMMFQFSIKETAIATMDATIPGSADSDGTTFTFDGTDTETLSFWFSTCFENGKVARFTVPYAKASEPVEAAVGETHVLWPTQIEALYDPADSASFPTFYLEP